MGALWLGLRGRKDTPTQQERACQFQATGSPGSSLGSSCPGQGAWLVRRKGLWSIVGGGGCTCGTGGARQSHFSREAVNLDFSVKSSDVSPFAS